MNKIALVLPYYGALPPYFNFFLRSLRGMNFDVLFFSDLAVEEYPENFKIIPMSFEEFKKLAAAKLEHSVRLDSPKRLCDFKPMYGKIFEDYLKDYAYWAFGDCDLVYGRLFAEDVAAALESGCDLYALHKCYISGPFCMIRNCARMNDLWREADNWEEVLTHEGSQCVAFDELLGDWHDQLWRGVMTIEECREKGDSFTAVVLRAQGLALRMKDGISETVLTDGPLYVTDGKLLRAEGEVPCFHYVRSKLRKYFTYVECPYASIHDYVIDDAGFYVTRAQIVFRKLINLSRKFKAAVRSLRNNGLARLSPGWGMRHSPDITGA